MDAECRHLDAGYQGVGRGSAFLVQREEVLADFLAGAQAGVVDVNVLTGILGHSKRVAERLTADFARTQPGRYVSVRFGNVLGSRGSVVHAFAAQIQSGGPITVTHPDVERFFMLIPEACQLVLEAGSMGTDGEVLVLEMGEQVKILEMATTHGRPSSKWSANSRSKAATSGPCASTPLRRTRSTASRSSSPISGLAAGMKSFIMWVPPSDRVQIRCTRRQCASSASGPRRAVPTSRRRVPPSRSGEPARPPRVRSRAHCG